MFGLLSEKYSKFTELTSEEEETIDSKSAHYFYIFAQTLNLVQGLKFVFTEELKFLSKGY